MKPLALAAQSEAKDAVLRMLQFARPPFPGSKLSWSLSGDFPRCMNNDPLGQNITSFTGVMSRFFRRGSNG